MLYRALKFPLAILVFSIMLVFLIVVSNGDSHHTNFRYLLWKYGITSDWEYGMRFFGVDPDFRAS